MTFAQHAATVAEKYPVFPFRPDRSAPYTRHGLKDATRDPARIAQWSRRWPDALIGVPTGQASGLFVLDVDCKGGKDGFVTLRRLGLSIPETRMHRTQHGNGAHYLFKAPGHAKLRNTVNSFGDGLDTRSDGGFIFWWPANGCAVVNPDLLADAPDWLIAPPGKAGTVPPLDTQAITIPAGLSTSNLDLGDPDAPLGLTHQQITGALQLLDPGADYDTWSRTGMAVFHETRGTGFAYWDEWSRQSSAKYPGQEELRKKWSSFGKYTGTPVTMRSVLKMVRDAGHDIPQGQGIPNASIATETADVQTIGRLAALPLFEYERVRKDEADRLGVRASTLDEAVGAARDSHELKGSHESVFDDVPLWDEPVDGEALLSEVASTIKRFIVCDPAVMVATTLWCAATWLVDDVHACPLLLINAPEKACGKTQLLTVVGRLVPRPAQAAGISPSVLFRMIEKYKPTLLVDEIETVLTREAEDLRGLFNAGHTRDSAFVWRSVPVGDDFEPRRFSVFGFKAIAGINADRLAETVTSRAIVAHLRRKKPGESVQRLRHAEPGLFNTLQRKLARWAADNAVAMRNARPGLPNELGDREQDNWEPLLTIADLAGPKWAHVARMAAVRTCTVSGESSQSTGVELLADIKNVFDSKKVTRIAMQDLRAALCADEEAPWATWSRGNPISVRRMGQLLKQYGVHSTAVKLPSGFSPKGYKLEAFQDAFGRYLYVPPATPVSLVT